MAEIPEVLVQVGKTIRQIRLSKGLSQQRLAEMCSFTFSYIGGVERAEKNIFKEPGQDRRCLGSRDSSILQLYAPL